MPSIETLNKILKERIKAIETADYTTTKADLVSSRVPMSQLPALPICILGTSFVGRCIVGMRAFIVGVDKVGEETVY